MWTNAKCAFYRKDDCAALNKLDCFDCRFYKSQEQLDDSIRKAKRRCEELGIQYGQNCYKSRFVGGEYE